MHFDANIVMFVALGVALAIAFTYHMTRPLGRYSVLAIRRVESGYSRIMPYAGSNAARSVEKYYLPRIKVTPGSDDEPPHMPF